MKSKERDLAALHHQEPDRVPTGENDVDYVLVEQLLGRSTLYNARWRERTALWDGRRDEIVADYSGNMGPFMGAKRFRFCCKFSKTGQLARVKAT